MKKARLE